MIPDDLSLTLAKLRGVSQDFDWAVFGAEANAKAGEGDALIASLRALAAKLRQSGLLEANVRLAIVGAILAELIR